MVSASIQQTLMDKAKHAVSTDKRNMMLSILTRDAEFTLLQNRAGLMKVSIPDFFVGGGLGSLLRDKQGRPCINQIRGGEVSEVFHRGEYCM
ncbi:unnamed protein product [Peronospora belbahrii]|uniref:Uncharacterized protein n=1 Tax=Peronospora belbahrii TaxID=622444 RepID=A0AAU9KRW1_9STRA|nr:unnamed protein product [Peronospora belbahrii]